MVSTGAIGLSEAASASPSVEGFACFDDLVTCETLGREANKDPARASQIQRERAEQRRLDAATQSESARPGGDFSAAATSNSTGYGYTTNQATNGAYYGWRLSRSFAGRALNYNLCTTTTSTTSCRFGGNVEVTASLGLVGRGTNSLRSRLTNNSSQVARPSFYISCDEKGFGQGGCGDKVDEVNPQILLNTSVDRLFREPVLSCGPEQV